jgi:hypothetical protein
MEQGLLTTVQKINATIPRCGQLESREHQLVNGIDSLSDETILYA